MKKLLTIILILLIATSVFGQEPYMKPMLGRQVNLAHQVGDFVGLWLFNEGSGDKAFDLSGNGKTATLTNGAYFSSAKFGSGVTFGGGNDYISIPALNISMAGCSIGMWVYPTKAVSFYYLDHESPRFAVYVSAGGTLYFYHDALKDLGTLPPVNTWSHIFLTVSETGYVNYYLNGIWVSGIATNTATSDLFSGTLTIGSRFSGDAYFGGRMDNIVIYDNVKTASEVALLYREPFCYMQGDLPVSQMYSYGPPPAGGGQVIMIQFSVIVFALILIKRRKFIKIDVS